MTNKCDILNAELFQDELMPKTLGALSVYDLMGMDCSIYVKKNNKFGFDVEIESDEESFDTYQDKSIHAYAIESLAEFCRRFLHSYSKLV